MARTVSFTQHGEPEWFSVGQRWKELTAEVSPAQAAMELGLEPTDVRTAQRWARAAHFVSTAYPSHVTGRPSLQVGVVAVLELAKIHRVDPRAADAIAERLLAGALSTAEVKREVAQALEGTERNKSLRAQSSSVWRSAFRQLAVRRLVEDRQLLGSLGTVASVREKAVRAAFEPDLVALFVNPSFDAGIVVRAPRDTAAKSVATVAADLLADIAITLLQDETALLVLPIEARRVAEATLAKWQECAKLEVRKSRKVYILLLSDDKQEFLRPEGQGE